MVRVLKRKGPRAPRISVDVPVEVQKKTFTLKAPMLRTLADYAAFLSAHHGKAIDEDRVLEGLITELSRDRAFGAWQRQAPSA